jgi:protein-tyrosine-phosphatase
LAVAAGIDFPYYLYEMLVEEKEEFNRVYRTNLYCRNLALDIEWIIANCKADKHELMLNTIPVYVCLREVMNLLTLNERSDTLTLDDPGPGLNEMWQISCSVFRRIIANVYVWLYQCVLSRRGLKVLLTSKMKHAKTILFLCSGNICRSPFAHLYAVKALHGCIDILSAGTIQKQGRLAPCEALDAAQNFGIDLSGHSSKFLTNEILGCSDLIFIFDKQNVVYLLQNHASVLHKTFLLGIYSGSRSTQISDPFGKNKLEYFRTYRLISQCIDRIIIECDANHSGIVDL